MRIYKEINLEWGMPIVSEAMKKLDSEIKVCKKDGIKFAKIIHGYGSTGKGGAIREECREVLSTMLKNKNIKKIVYGALAIAALIYIAYLGIVNFKAMGIKKKEWDAKRNKK